MPERPEDPVLFAREFFHSTPQAEIDAALAENSRLKSEIADVEARIAEVQKQLDEFDA
jgi:hypothetical protein